MYVGYCHYNLIYSYSVTSRDFVLYLREFSALLHIAMCVG